MPKSGVVRWLRVALDDVVFAITSLVRPWTDLSAVKTTQADLVRALADHRAELAQVTADLNALEQRLGRLEAAPEAEVRPPGAELERLRDLAAGGAPLRDRAVAQPLDTKSGK